MLEVRLWLIQTELERDLCWDQDKLACMISCECFHTTTGTVPVPVPMLWHKNIPTPVPGTGPVQVLSE